MPEANSVAAIDAGSNGIRIAIAELDEAGKTVRTHNQREAMRLGEDSFSLGAFQPQTIARAVAAFEKFAHLLAEHHVTAYRAVATSACREARNRTELIAAVAQATGIKLEIIGGIEEAQIVFAGVSDVVNIAGESAVLIDMGGGSVEITVARDGQPLGCETLPLGPVRLMQQLKAQGADEREITSLMTRYEGKIRSLVEAELDAPPAICIGTGGNIEAMAKLRVPLLGKTKTGKVKAADLDPMIEKLLSMSVPQRIEKLELRPDRADVIGIALVVFRMIVREIAVPKVLVPGVGLKEGMLKQLTRK